MTSHADHRRVESDSTFTGTCWWRWAFGLVLALAATPLLVPAALAADPPEAEVPSGWLATVQQQIAADEYHVTWQSRTALLDLDQSWQSPNRAQGFRTYFTPRGIRVIPRQTGTDEVPAWEWSLALVGYGADGRSWTVPEAEQSAEGNRIEYHRAGLTEWYVNEPRGLKQGFTLPAPPDEYARGTARTRSASPRPRAAVVMSGRQS